MKYPHLPIKPWGAPPSKTIAPRRDASSQEIFDGDELHFEAGKRYYFDRNINDGENEYHLIEFTQTEEINPNYEEQLANYEATQAQYAAAMATYEAEMKEWDASEKQRKLALFNNLKQELGL
jgi:hypothetical protein